MSWHQTSIAANGASCLSLYKNNQQSVKQLKKAIITIGFWSKLFLIYLSKALRWKLQSHHKESEEHTQLPQSLHLNYGLQEEKPVVIFSLIKVIVL